MNPELYNGLTLAYIGDAIYEIYVRKYYLNKYTKVKDLHKATSEVVNASMQAKIADYLLDNNILTDIETTMYLRGRNSHVASRRKIDLNLYHKATGFEAVIGYLYLKNELIRLDEILNIIFEKSNLIKED